MRAEVIVLNWTATVPVVASHRRPRAAGQENDFQTRDGREGWLLRTVAPLHNGRAVTRLGLRISYCRMTESSDGYIWYVEVVCLLCNRRRVVKPNEPLQAARGKC